jgi:aquaporin Z
MFDRKKIAMALAEFLGTGMLTLVVLSVARSTVGIPYFVALAAGVAVALLVLVFGSVSGAQLNPALTLGLWTGRRVKTAAAVVYVAMQLLGAFLAYLLYTYLVNTHWSNSGHFTARIMLAEAAGMFVFAFGWVAAIHQKYESGRFAAVVCLAVATGIIVASAASNGFINPAVALGARSWGWGTYVLGPVVGSIIAVNLYDVFFGNMSKVSAASSSSSTTRSTAKVTRTTTRKKKK